MIPASLFAPQISSPKWAITQLQKRHGFPFFYSSLLLCSHPQITFSFPSRLEEILNPNQSPSINSSPISNPNPTAPSSKNSNYSPLSCLLNTTPATALSAATGSPSRANPSSIPRQPSNGASTPARQDIRNVMSPPPKNFPEPSPDIMPILSPVFHTCFWLTPLASP